MLKSVKTVMMIVVEEGEVFLNVVYDDRQRKRLFLRVWLNASGEE